MRKIKLEKLILMKRILIALLFITSFASAQLDSIKFRTLVKAGYTTKGSSLTWLEEDRNKEIFLDFLLAFSSGNIAPWSNATTYDVQTFSQYVSNSGNIYRFIGSGPSLNQSPALNPSVWEPTTMGALSHAQNTDMFLAGGTALQVSALTLHNLILDQVIQITASGLTTAIGLSALRPGYLYYIYDKGIFTRALNSTTLDEYGIGLMKNPDFQNTKTKFMGVWSAALSVTINKYAIWDNVVYKNLTGTNTGTNPSSDATNWDAVDYSTDPDAFVIEPEVVRYHLADDFISYRADKRGNKIDTYTAWTVSGHITNNLAQFQFGDDNIRNCVAIDGFASIDTRNNTGDIAILNVFNGATASCYGNKGVISQVKINNGAVTITRNATRTLVASIFSRYAAYTIDPAQNYSGLTIDDNNSNLSVTIPITGLSTLNFSVLPSTYPSLLGAGAIVFTSTNATETITAVNSISSLKGKIKFIPESGLSLDLNTTDLKFKGGASFFTLDGTVGAWIEIGDPLTGGAGQYELNSATGY